jgi:4-amino-4-deoxy-L-arabinose transferase-like glycosyltransferase
VGANSSSSIAGTASEPSLFRIFSFDRASALRGLRARSHLVWLSGILLAALVVRLVWVASVQPDPRDGRFDDSVWYDGTAHNLDDGKGYVFPGAAFCRGGTAIGIPSHLGMCDAHSPTALWAPGYPVVLAGLFLLPGDDVAAARVLNIIAALALVGGVYYLSSRLWDKRGGLIAAAIMAGFPSHIFYSSLVMTEVFFAGLISVLLCLVYGWTLRERVVPWRVFLIGVVAGAVGMVRPEGALIVLAIIAAWLAYHRALPRVAGYVALLVLGMAVLYVPWTVRNIVQLHAPIVGTTGLGQVLIQGHYSQATGRPDLYAVTRLWDRFAGVPFPQREVSINNAGVRDSVAYAVHHIWRELGLAPDRLAWFFRGDDSGVFWVNHAGGSKPQEFSAAWGDRWMAIANVYYYAVIAVMVLGLPFWLLRMDRRHVLIWAPFVVYTAMWTFFFVGEARYHFPLLPVFAVLAGIGASAFIRTLLRERAPLSST